MADTSAPDDYQTSIQDLINQTRELLKPVQAPATTGQGQGGFGGFIGDVGNVLSGGSQGLLGLSPDESDAAGRRALLNFGINMLAASGKSYAPKDFGTVLAAGLSGAQQSRLGSEQLAASRLGAQQAYQNQRLEQIGKVLPLLQLQQRANMPNPFGPTAATPAAPGGSIAEAIKPFTYPNLPSDITPAEDQMVRTVFGEANGQPLEGQQGVASVIKNRMASSGQSAQDVIFAKNQFEPWNTARRAQLEGLSPDDPRYQAILKNVVRPVMSGDVKDPTGGATHFYAPKLMADRGQPGGPDWASGQQPSKIIGGHNFYKLPYGGGTQTAAVQPPASPQTPPGAPTVQVGGPAPAPPGAAPGSATPAPQGIGAALQPPAGSSQYTVGPPSPVIKAAPIPAGRVRAADAIVGGINLAQATPGGGTLTAGPGAGPTVAPSAPWPGTAGAGALSYSDNPTIAAPAAKPPGAVTQPPPGPAPGSWEEFQTQHRTPIPPEAYTVGVDPGILKAKQDAVAEAQKNMKAAEATYASAQRTGVGDVNKSLSDRNTASAALQKAQQDYDTFVQDAAKQTITNRQTAEAKQTDTLRQLYADEQQRKSQIALKQLEGEQTRLTNKEAVFNAANQKGLETAGKEQGDARDVVAQLEGFGAISDNVGQPGWMQTTKFPGSDQTIAERLQQLGVKMDDTGGVQLLRGGINNLVKTLRQGMAMGSLSDRDLSFIERMGPTEWMDKDTRSAAVGYLKQAYQAKYNFARDVQKEMSRGKNYGDALDAANAQQKPFVPAASAELTQHWTDMSPEWVGKRTQWARENDIRPGTLYHLGDGSIHVMRSPQQPGQR